jgi:hypothetical protein
MPDPPLTPTRKTIAAFQARVESRVANEQVEARVVMVDPEHLLKLIEAMTDLDRLLIFLKSSKLDLTYDRDIGEGSKRVDWYRNHPNERYRQPTVHEIIELDDRHAYYGFRFFFDVDGKLIHVCGHP